MTSDKAQNIILDILVTGFSLFPCFYLSIWEKVAKETNSECVFLFMDLWGSNIWSNIPILYELTWTCPHVHADLPWIKWPWNLLSWSALRKQKSLNINDFQRSETQELLLQPDHALRILINLNVWILYIIQDLHKLHIDPPVDKHTIRSLSCLRAVPGPCWYAWQWLPEGPKSTLICT